MIIGTAGHIDHGKTSLVRALTGVDTDRLPEEKTRGMSIELGYAYAPLAGDELTGFVDVPGHERFVHTMLAGATGIDFALLVVAADDGPMPQTREHLNILNLLGLHRGAVALTKIDLVDAGRVAEVQIDLHALLAGTPLANAPICAVSTRTGQGLPALRAVLADAASQPRPAKADAHFRLAVDRSFTLAGAGTIVTGTVHSGSVRAGDQVVVAPGGRTVRIRGIHAQNRAANIGTAGERCALNLAGIARDEVRRGDWIVAPPIALATDRIDVQLALLGAEQKLLKSGAAMHLHLGASHVPARMVVLDDAPAGDVEPGAFRLVQFILQRPIAAWHGDRFIVRDASATRTLGGGRVLDPFAPVRYRRTERRLQVLAALDSGAVSSRLAALLGLAPLGVDLVRFAQVHNVRDIGTLLASLPAKPIVGAGMGYAIGEGHWAALQAQALAALTGFHRGNPDQPGPDAARLKRIAFPKLADGLYLPLVRHLVSEGKCCQSGPWLHLPEHDNKPSPQERVLLERLLPLLLDSAFDPPWVRDLAKRIEQPEALVRKAMLRAAKRGEIFQIVNDLFYHADAIRDLATIVNQIQAGEGTVRAAVFRDRTALGRKRAIQILEFFDRVGVTRRARDVHLVRAENLLTTANVKQESAGL